LYAEKHSDRHCLSRTGFNRLVKFFFLAVSIDLEEIVEGQKLAKRRKLLFLWQ